MQLITRPINIEIGTNWRIAHGRSLFHRSWQPIYRVGLTRFHSSGKSTDFFGTDLGHSRLSVLTMHIVYLRRLVNSEFNPATLNYV
jgi:hypothetical protein